MNKPKTYDELRTIVSNVEYLDWQFYVYNEGVYYLQIHFQAPDMVTGNMEWQFCRRWLLSPTMTETEIVSTCWCAVRAAIEHEARENFKYAPKAGMRKRPVFQPHLDVEAIYEMAAKKENLDIAEGESSGEWVKGALMNSNGVRRLRK